MKKGLIISLFVLLAGIMIFTSCGGTTTITATTTQVQTQTQTTTATQVKEPYGTLTDVAATFGYDNFDPNLVSSWSGLIFQTLMRTTEAGDFEGDVLSGWDLSADGKTWTFHLLPNNKFTNGDPVNAAAVKYSIERFAESARSAWSPYLREAYNRVAVNVVDDLTVEYVTAHAEPTLVASFSATSIVNKAAIDQIGEDAYFANPSGSGPWKLVGYAAGTSVKFEANTGYCRANEVPHFQYYQQFLVPELATRISMFKTGQADVLGLDDYARLRELANEGWATRSGGINGTDSFSFQATWLPEAGATYDIRIRQAMSYALNRQEICDTWYSGYAIPGGSFFMPTGVFGWTDELAPDPYDPDHARALIAEAGYPDAFTNPVITVFCQAADKDRLLYYSSYWTAVGLQININVMSTSAYWGYLFKRPAATDVNVGWIWFWKSWGYVNSVYHSANMYTSTGVHGTANDPTADAMYQVITQQKDYATAWEKMSEFQVYVKSLYVNVGVVEYQNIVLYNQHTLGSWNGRNWEGGYMGYAGITHPVA
jgi:peptide/nickel transport system substrate-binding protein